MKTEIELINQARGEMAVELKRLLTAAIKRINRTKSPTSIVIPLGPFNRLAKQLHKKWRKKK